MTMFPSPASILYQISESDLEKLILKAEERGFALGQKKPVEEPLHKDKAAKYLGIKSRTLDKWIQEGIIPSKYIHRPNGTPYFLASELSEFIKES